MNTIRHRRTADPRSSTSGEPEPSSAKQYRLAPPLAARADETKAAEAWEDILDTRPSNVDLRTRGGIAERDARAMVAQMRHRPGTLGEATLAELNALIHQAAEAGRPVALTELCFFVFHLFFVSGIGERTGGQVRRVMMRLFCEQAQDAAERRAMFAIAAAVRPALIEDLPSTVSIVDDLINRLGKRDIRHLVLALVELGNHLASYRSEAILLGTDRHHLNTCIRRTWDAVQPYVENP